VNSRAYCTVQRALSNGEWKAATVLAGSLIEALLLWKLQRDEANARMKAQNLYSSGQFDKKPADDLDKWNLHEYIIVSLELGLITDETAKQSKLAKNFRNLIHPGRAKRDGLLCDQGTALSAAAGVYHVIRDLG
jgi:hypothetical protein